MHEIIVVQCSYRKQGTSAMLSDLLKDMDERVHVVTITTALHEYDKFCQLIKRSHTLVIIGPCYINTYPADVFLLLKYLQSKPELFHGQKIYGLIQGGMPYIHTHVSGLRSLELFAKSMNLSYCGGFVLGMGALLNGRSLNKLPHGKRVKRQLTKFYQSILEGTKQSIELCESAELHIPIWITKILCRKMNNKLLREAKFNGYDLLEESYYVK
ncbi:hypothetical protein [Thomasclavelia sp.]